MGRVAGRSKHLFWLALKKLRGDNSEFIIDLQQRRVIFSSHLGRRTDLVISLDQIRAVAVQRLPKDD